MRFEGAWPIKKVFVSKRGISSFRMLPKHLKQETKSVELVCFSFPSHTTRQGNYCGLRH